MSGIVGHRGLLLGAGGVGDPYWSNVSLLIDGTQGSIADLGPLGLTITTTGSASVSGGGGTGYLDFPASSGNAFNVTEANAGSAFAFSTGDFTIEVDSWRATSGVEAILIDTRRSADSAPRCASHYVSTTNRLAIYDSSVVTGDSGSTLSTSTWHRVVFTRVSGTLVAYLNGSRVWGASYGGSYSASSPCVIGNNFAFSASVGHRMRHVRITKGVSRYGNNATITQDAAPFPHA